MHTPSISVAYTDETGHTSTVSLTGQSERDRRQARLGVFEPGDGDVGVYADVPRTVYPGVTFSPGLVVENAMITNRLSVPKNSGQDLQPVTLRNCELVGPLIVPAGGDGIIAATGANHLVLILEDCTIHPQAAHYFRNGAMGHHVVMRGCDVYEGVDGFDVFNSSDPDGPTGVVIEGSRFHRSSYFAANPAGTPGSQTHNDTGLQIMGGSGTRIVGNSFLGFLAGGAVNTHGTNTANSCIMIKPDSGTISDLVIRNNWFTGGRVPINLAQDTAGRVLGEGICIIDNVFEHDSDVDIAVLMPASATGVVCTGNVYADGSTAVISRNG